MMGYFLTFVSSFLLYKTMVLLYFTLGIFNGELKTTFILGVQRTSFYGSIIFCPKNFVKFYKLCYLYEMALIKSCSFKLTPLSEECPLKSAKNDVVTSCQWLPCSSFNILDLDLKFIIYRPWRVLFIIFLASPVNGFQTIEP